VPISIAGRSSGHCLIYGEKVEKKCFLIVYFLEGGKRNAAWSRGNRSKLKKEGQRGEEKGVEKKGKKLMVKIIERSVREEGPRKCIAKKRLFAPWGTRLRNKKGKRQGKDGSDFRVVFEERVDDWRKLLY